MGWKPCDYQDHFMELARMKLGTRRANALLSDAGRRSEAYRERLSRLMGMTLRRYDTGERHVILGYTTSGSPNWQGQELIIASQIPETAIGLMPGRRLGDIVEGTGLDERIIEEAVTMQGMTSIRVTTQMAAAEDILLDPISALLGPVRRIMTHMANFWHDMTDKSKQAPPTLGYLGMEATLVVTGLFMVMAMLMKGILAVEVEEVPGTFVYPLVAGIAGGMLWATMALGTSLWLDVRLWLTQRT